MRVQQIRHRIAIGGKLVKVQQHSHDIYYIATFIVAQLVYNQCHFLFLMISFKLALSV